MQLHSICVVLLVFTHQSTPVWCVGIEDISTVNMDLHSVLIQWSIDEDYYNDTLQTINDGGENALNIIQTRVQLQSVFGIDKWRRYVDFDQTGYLIEQLRSGSIYRVCVATVPSHDDVSNDVIIGSRRCARITTALQTWNASSKAAVAMTVILFIALVTFKLLDILYPRKRLIMIPDDKPKDKTEEEGDGVKMRPKKENYNKKTEKKKQIDRNSFDFDTVVDVDDRGSSVPSEWIHGV